MVSNWLLVAVGGAAGAVLRVYLSETIPSSGFPWATLSVNLVGSLLLGAITAAALTNVVDEATALMLGAGFLGAFTTMSTFSVETITLVDEGRWSAAGAYVVLKRSGLSDLRLSWLEIHPIVGWLNHFRMANILFSASNEPAWTS